MDHQPSGYEFEQTLGESDGEGSLACCSPGGRKESDTIETELTKLKVHYANAWLDESEAGI